MVVVVDLLINWPIFHGGGGGGNVFTEWEESEREIVSSSFRNGHLKRR